MSVELQPRFKKKDKKITTKFLDNLVRCFIDSSLNKIQMCYMYIKENFGLTVVITKDFK